MLVFVLWACQSPKEAAPFNAAEQAYLQTLLPTEALADETNALAGQPEAEAFGELLFFEHELSPQGVSCASCHDPNHAFSDPLPLSIGISETGRHSPSLLGVAHQRWLNWDGSCDSLWCQAIGPIEKANEMGSTRTRLTSVIADLERLRTPYEALFGPLPAHDHWPLDAAPGEMDPVLNEAWLSLSDEDKSAATGVLVNVAKSIAAYEATLTIPEAPIDELAIRYQDDPEAAFDWLDADARRGLELFTGEGQCNSCHLGSLGSNLEFHNIGLPLSDTLDPDDLGRYLGIEALRENPFNSAGEYSDDPSGFKANRIDQLIQSTEQLGQFKVPHLRNLTSSAPYMHSGQFETLEAVVRHYSEMDDVPLQGHIEDFLQPQNWSDDDIESLVSFLELFSAAN